MVLLLSKPQDSPARAFPQSQCPQTFPPNVIPLYTSYHPPLCLEAVVNGPPFTRHCDWFHLGGCLDAILFAPPMSDVDTASTAASPSGKNSGKCRPVCTAAWLPFDHPCLRPVTALPPSPENISRVPPTPLCALCLSLLLSPRLSRLLPARCRVSLCPRRPQMSTVISSVAQVSV